jgi:D-3-phosphoglycerate dehydrogenase
MIVSGTLFSEDASRIIDIDGFDMEIEPRGKMILFRNSDVPGVIGEVGMLLAQHNINIADFRLGRNDKKEAMAVIVVDEAVSSDVLGALSAMKAALKVSYLEL